MYYACVNAERIFNIPLDKIRDSLWFSHLSNEPELMQNLVVHDLQQQGYFNGYVSFSGSEQMYFCDYGKRYDVDGNHIGYDMVLTATHQDNSDYVRNFYKGIVERVKQDPNLPIEQAYENEKKLVEQNVGTEFSEFLLAILEDHEN